MIWLDRRVRYPNILTHPFSEPLAYLFDVTAPFDLIAGGS